MSVQTVFNLATEDILDEAARTEILPVHRPLPKGNIIVCVDLPVELQKLISLKENYRNQISRLQSKEIIYEESKALRKKLRAKINLIEHILEYEYLAICPDVPKSTHFEVYEGYKLAYYK